MKYINTVLICLVAVGSVACSAVKQCQAPQLNLPDNIAGRVDSLTVADVAWWEFYGDTILCRIIERTLSDNKNIRSAAARVEQMQQMYRISKANRLPNVSIGVLGDYETNDYYGEAPLRDPQFDLKATVRWEADLW
ncbi:MAG: TolC family protein, partial [Alistipes sp.]|nr:TolC family protein [Alistipes sp.]